MPRISFTGMMNQIFAPTQGGDHILELAGYYDGANVQLLEGGDIKKYQRVKIIVTDDFIDEYKVAYLEGIDEK